MTRTVDTSETEPFPHVFLFLDTNIVMHFEMFDAVDWPTVVKAKEVTLVLDRVVLGELEKFKNDRTNEGRRDRVRTIFPSWIHT